jgi:hypothetical protein
MNTPIPPPIPSVYPYSDFHDDVSSTVVDSQDKVPSTVVEPEPFDARPLQVTKLDLDEEVFETGVYRHYAGGYYYAHALGWYRQSGRRQRVVIYMSTSTCEFFVLPWCDPVHFSWTDAVQLAEGATPVPRFVLIGRSIHLREPVSKA